MDTIAKGSNLVAEIDGFQLAYDDFGEGEVIIFLHGFPFCKAMWKDQLDFFKSRHRVIALDIRGFGRSKDEESTLSIDLFGDDLIAFMDKLSIQKAIICGLSMGGYIALNVLKKFPHRFEALVLCDTQCNADPQDVKEKRYRAIEDINANGSREFNEEFVTSVFHENTLRTNPELVETLRNWVFSNTDQIITMGLTALAGRMDTCSALNGITIPTLIICGLEDKVTPLAQSEIMHAAVKGSVLKVIDGAGHVSNLEQPEAFNKILADFITVLEDAKVTE
ncbi:MAG TPA: alpha/beta hydrolase [Fluviicola sp.]|nr:alpha/beta hydrolase [Fluviicola sp.]